ncbi:MAG: hypothetical protein SGJ24_18705 [Chloroflexota bacterium]|nr:hypothetical protein [Chloroflexota bacterium]
MCAIIILAFFALFGFATFGSLAPTSDPAMLLLATPMTSFDVPPLSASTPVPLIRATPSPEKAIIVPPDTTVIACEPIAPAVSRALVDRMHEQPLGADVGWIYTPSEAQFKTIGTWVNENLGSVAYMELLHYDCGIPPNAVDDYFNATTYPVFFGAYDSYSLVNSCTQGEMRHFVFESSLNGIDYESRWWFEPLAPTRLAMFMLTTPVSQGSNITPLVRQLYPDLPNCRNVG